MSSNYSSFYAKGTVEIIATDVATGEVVQRQAVNNTIVRDGRIALAKLITGESALDKSYLILDMTFPKTYAPSPDLHNGWLGIINSGVVSMYYLGPLYTSSALAN